MANPTDVACPTCGETAGRYCVWVSSNGEVATATAGVDSHPARIALAAQPTAEAKRWIRLSELLEDKVRDLRTSDPPSDISVAVRLAYLGIAELARRIAEEV